MGRSLDYFTLPEQVHLSLNFRKGKKRVSHHHNRGEEEMDKGAFRGTLAENKKREWARRKKKRKEKEIRIGEPFAQGMR